MPRVVGSTLWFSSGRLSFAVATLKTRSDGADVAVIPRSFQAAASDKGKNVRIYKTLKQGCATHGPGAEVLWTVARGKGQIFKQASQFLKVLPVPD